jgi:hypothetical protein
MMRPGERVLSRDEVEPINRAQGGHKWKTFRDEGRWKQTLELKPEYVIIQSGHNNEPGKHRSYVDEATAALKPILITWLTAETHVPLLDLHARSFALYEEMGQEGVREISPLKPGGLYSTRLNVRGGEIIGRLDADALRQAVPVLNPYLKATIPS